MLYMNPEQLLAILSTAERLKCTPRHSWTSSGRRESVAEHSWRLSLLALLVTDEFPDLDMDRVIRMCLIHDLGEAFTGDIPSFQKTKADSATEDQKLDQWIATFPMPLREELQALLQEMGEMKTKESRLYKALDNLEAVIQHNEADISTWLPLEYELQYTYGSDKVGFSPWLQQLKSAIDRRTTEIIAGASASAAVNNHMKTDIT